MTMKKTIIEMIEKVPGGKNAVAGFLGFTESELNNRLYQTKGQRFKNEELIAVQQEFGCSQFIEALCLEAGGRFVPDVAENELDEVELANLQLHELSARGLLFAVLEKALEDGEITSQEEDKIRQALGKHLAATQYSIECVISLNKRK
ncbi:MAG: YmfL family putative regulatory protein [Haemophilus parainfluenzae]|uniref:YmfL family putative regulatory protein n=1 Tax=uncultured Haemophilus sp. TaxID=237779 RepID=UPI002804FA66|nr:YmfL family putative regulatory protein [uncultured Haemophilus sp.]MDU4566293.1 YmfL family putative regulatory protein [Haemophilus parainfluenzae]MDU4638138.1 YmfL family putative regulatory protein [Haemophilus parainfluenzae]MDU5990927.1 YmfL family putative regulatory protein [Haemophilus parainfluenzae]